MILLLSLPKNSIAQVFDISIPTKLFHPLQSAAELAVNISTLLFKMPIALSPAI